MKQLNSIIVTILMFFLLFGAIVAANTNVKEDVQTKNILDPQIKPLLSVGYANITIYLSEGEGCGCKPIREAPIRADGLTTDHNDSGMTDTDGMVVLELEYDQTYRVYIEVEGFQRNLFDLDIVDHQTFTFHLKQGRKSTETPTFLSGLMQLLQRIETVKTQFALLQ